jgi:hypothetical protein
VGPVGYSIYSIDTSKVSPGQLGWAYPGSWWRRLRWFPKKAWKKHPQKDSSVFPGSFVWVIIHRICPGFLFLFYLFLGFAIHCYTVVFWLLKAPTAESPHARLAGHKHLSRSDYLAVGLSWAGIISCQPRINKPRLINCGSARSSKWLVKWYPPNSTA